MTHRNPLLTTWTRTAMGVKTQRSKPEKCGEYLIQPVTSPKLAVGLSTFAKLRRVVFALGLGYLVYSWVSSKGQTRLSGQNLQEPRIIHGRKAERIFLQIPNPESIATAHRKYASHAHVAGSEQDLVTAKIVLNSFYDYFGLTASENLIYEAGSMESHNAIYDISQKDSPRAWIDTYYPLLDTPHEQSLEIVDVNDDILWKADLGEVCDPLDEDANRSCLDVPPYHGFSADGNVTGELVYANYGDLEDFEELEKRGVNINGSIILVRYGANMRGLKVKNAEERGAAGVLIYSDVRDDGGITVENGFLPYPQGPARNPSVIQRGSVQYISTHPGDPTTPGVPSHKNATRVKQSVLPFIPSLPLSHENSQHFLSELNKTGSVRLRLINKVDKEIKPIWNTMALIPGLISDEVVVVGNHRDAWVLGAVDPSSGSACMDEVLRAFGVLYQKGWRPLRSIIFASWDAEEYGIIGSTEWVEDFATWIGKHVVAYVNIDGGVGGTRWGASASPSLSHFMYRVAEDIPHPIKENATLWDARQDVGPFIPPNTTITQETFADDLQSSIGVLGSGSDYTAFLQFAGVASTTSGFDSAPGDAAYPYHSTYDSIRFVEKFVDPGYRRFDAMSKYLGLQTLRLADSVVLPFNTTFYALQLSSYAEKVMETAKELDISVDLTPLHVAISELLDTSLEFEKEKEEAKKVLFESLRRWRKRHFFKSIWTRVCRLFKKWFCKYKEESSYGGLPTGHLLRSGHRLPRNVKQAIKRVRGVNAKLQSFESGFISEEGLPGRTWFKHFGVAPGRWLGYGATTLPALTESITLDKNATQAKIEVLRLSKMVRKLAKHIDG